MNLVNDPAVLAPSHPYHSTITQLHRLTEGSRRSPGSRHRLQSPPLPPWLVSTGLAASTPDPTMWAMTVGENRHSLLPSGVLRRTWRFYVGRNGSVTRFEILADMGTLSGVRLSLAAKLAWAVSVLSFIGGVYLGVANEDGSTELVAAAIRNFSFVAIASLALLILRRQPSNRVAWAVMLAGVAFPVEVLFVEFTEYAVSTWGEVGVTLWAGWVARWIWIAQPLTVPLVLLYYPNGELPSPRWKPAVIAIWSSALLGWFYAAFSPMPMEEFGGLENPVAISELPGWMDFIAAITFTALLLLPLLGALSLIPRYRRSKGVERQQMKLIAWVGVVSVLYLVVFSILVELGPIGEAITTTLFTLYVGVTLTAGIVRYRVFDIDRIISRSISYTVVAVILGGAFALAVVTIPNALGVADSPLVVAASTLAAAALFDPLRRRVQRGVDRRFNRSKFQADQVAEDFSSHISGSLTTEQLARQLVRTATTHLEPTSAGIWLNRRDDSH